MTPERWKRFDQLLDSALGQEERQRAALLNAACADDEVLRLKVDWLLAHKDQAGSFIEAPA
jgi:hypothetical protein